MRMLKIAAAVAPCLVAVLPATAQQKPVSREAASAARAPAVVVAHPRLQLEITGGLGYTAVDMNGWAGTSNGANNWSNLNYSGSARLLIPVGKDVRLGVEAGYNYHFWYNVYVGPPSYTYQYDVTATHVAALVRVPLARRITADLGAGMHFFNNAGTHAGALGGITYAIPAGSVTIPVGVRADFIFTNPMVLPITVNAGVRVSL